MSESDVRAEMAAAMAHPVQEQKVQHEVRAAEPSQQPGAGQARLGGLPADPANPQREA
jgi:hypothetical protein